MPTSSRYAQVVRSQLMKEDNTLVSLWYQVEGGLAENMSIIQQNMDALGARIEKVSSALAQNSS